MSRITKQIALTVANQLVLPKRQELKTEENKLSEIVTEVYRAKIPIDILMLFETKRKYFKTKNYLKINGNGFNFTPFSMVGLLPDNNDIYCSEFSVKECDKIHRQFNIVEDCKKEIDKLRFDIQTAIFNLRTYNNVEKEFPEAFKLLPIRQTTALVVNLKDIRCKLDKSNC